MSYHGTNPNQYSFPKNLPVPLYLSLKGSAPQPGGKTLYDVSCLKPYRDTPMLHPMGNDLHSIGLEYYTINTRKSMNPCGKN
jgi:hypothetical protein